MIHTAGALLAVRLAGAAGAAVPEHSTVLPGMGAADPRARVDAGQPPWRSVARRLAVMSA